MQIKTHSQRSVIIIIVHTYTTAYARSDSTGYPIRRVI